jgi:D-glycero-beta-D-manno-heptose 1-phosphate adenylyltransferase
MTFESRYQDMCAYTTADKIMSRADLVARTHLWRLLNQKVVFTNGCFDLLHLGHVDYLERARALGHALIVGVNSDASVRRQNKGPERPLQNEEARSRIIAALQFVDAVVLFDEDTPLDLILSLRPDVLVKGDDYAITQIVGGAEVIGWGGSVQTIPLVQGHSTTRIVQKIKAE